MLLAFGPQLDEGKGSDMRWEGNRESDNVEDRRGEDGGGGFGLGGRSIGIGTVAIALVASYFFGISPGTVISLLSRGQAGRRARRAGGGRRPGRGPAGAAARPGGRRGRASGGGRAGGRPPGAEP